MPTARLRSSATPGRPADRTLPPTHPERDWATVAEVAWLDAAVASAEVVDTERAIVANDEHQERGRDWLADNGPEHPQHARGQRKLRDLERFQARLVIARDFGLLRCWTSCRDLYVATQYGSAARHWMAAEQPGVDLSSPFAIWRAVMSERPAPGSWPPEEREHWIVRPGRIEVWHLEELRDRYREEVTA